MISMEHNDDDDDDDENDDDDDDDDDNINWVKTMSAHVHGRTFCYLCVVCIQLRVNNVLHVSGSISLLSSSVWLWK